MCGVSITSLAYWKQNIRQKEVKNEKVAMQEGTNISRCVRVGVGS